MAQQQLWAGVRGTVLDKQGEQRRDFLWSGWTDFLNSFLRSEGSMQHAVELYSLVYHISYTREQKQLKARREAVCNASGSAGAPAGSCLHSGSSVIMLASEGNKWVWKWCLGILSMLDAAVLQTRVCLLTKDMLQLKFPAGLVFPEGSIFAFTFLKAFIYPTVKNGSGFFFFFFYPSSLSSLCAIFFFLIWFWNSTNVHLFFLILYHVSILQHNFSFLVTRQNWWSVRH